MEKCVRCGVKKERIELDEHNLKLYCRACHIQIHKEIKTETDSIWKIIKWKKEVLRLGLIGWEEKY